MGYEFGGPSPSPELSSFPMTNSSYESHSDSSSSGSYDMGQMSFPTVTTHYDMLPLGGSQMSYYTQAEKIPVEYIDTTTLDDGTGRHRRSSQSKDAVTTMHLRRRAQNRASQRAFRARKEKHVKGLENQLQDLHDRHQTLIHSFTQQSDEVQKLHDRIEDLVAELDTFRPVADNISFNNNNNNDFQTPDKFGMIQFAATPYRTPEPYFDKSPTRPGNYNGFPAEMAHVQL